MYAYDCEKTNNTKIGILYTPCNVIETRNKQQFFQNPLTRPDVLGRIRLPSSFRSFRENDWQASTLRSTASANATKSKLLLGLAIGVGPFLMSMTNFPRDLAATLQFASGGLSLFCCRGSNQTGSRCGDSALSKRPQGFQVVW